MRFTHVSWAAVVFTVMIMTAFMLTGCEDQNQPVRSMGSDAQMTGTYPPPPPPPPPPDLENCETAFGKLSGMATCFRNIDENGDGRRDFSRWGWTNGPLTTGTYTLDLYAGAGQCDVSKGTLVGEVVVTYSGSTVTVTYDVLPGVELNDVHVYVGSAILPTNNGKFTVAPGQYPQGADAGGADTYTFTFTNVSGPIFVVAHAEVCPDSD